MGNSSLPKAVLFDNDGVLAASEPLHREAWRRLFLQLGLPYDEAALRAMAGKTAPQTIARYLDEYRPGWSPEEFDVQDLAQRKNDIYVTLKPEIALYDGVLEGLRWLKSRDVKIAVVSNARRKELTQILKHLGVFDLFDTVVSRDESSNPKPDPSGYLLAAASCEAGTGECLAVEDSPPGIEAALVAKIPAAAVLTNFTREVMEAPVPGRPDLKPAWIGDSPRDFFDWLRARAR